MLTTSRRMVLQMNWHTGTVISNEYALCDLQVLQDGRV
jgi:hypothetical protein